MNPALYYSHMHRILEQHLTRCSVLIAYPKEWQEKDQVYHGNTRFILGFLIVEKAQGSGGLIVHYLYTRRDMKKGGIDACFRNQGIARTLIQTAMNRYETMNLNFTVWGADMVAFPELAAKVTDEYKAVYNNFLFYIPLLHEWWKGLPARTTDKASVEAIKLAEQYVQTALR